MCRKKPSSKISGSIGRKKKKKKNAELIRYYYYYSSSARSEEGWETTCFLATNLPNSQTCIFLFLSSLPPFVRGIQNGYIEILNWRDPGCIIIILRHTHTQCTEPVLPLNCHVCYPSPIPSIHPSFPLVCLYVCVCLALRESPFFSGGL